MRRRSCGASRKERHSSTRTLKRAGSYLNLMRCFPSLNLLLRPSISSIQSAIYKRKPNTTEPFRELGVVASTQLQQKQRWLQLTFIGSSGVRGLKSSPSSVYTQPLLSMMFVGAPKTEGMTCRGVFFSGSCAHPKRKSTGQTRRRDNKRSENAPKTNATVCADACSDHLHFLDQLGQMLLFLLVRSFLVELLLGRKRKRKAEEERKAK